MPTMFWGLRKLRLELALATVVACGILCPLAWSSKVDPPLCMTSALHSTRKSLLSDAIGKLARLKMKEERTRIRAELERSKFERAMQQPDRKDIARLLEPLSEAQKAETAAAKEFDDTVNEIAHLADVLLKDMQSSQEAGMITVFIRKNLEDGNPVPVTGRYIGLSDSKPRRCRMEVQKEDGTPKAISFHPSLLSLEAAHFTGERYPELALPDPSGATQLPDVVAEKARAAREQKQRNEPRAKHFIVDDEAAEPDAEHTKVNRPSVLIAEPPKPAAPIRNEQDFKKASRSAATVAERPNPQAEIPKRLDTMVMRVRQRPPRPAALSQKSVEDLFAKARAQNKDGKGLHAFQLKTGEKIVAETLVREGHVLILLKNVARSPQIPSIRRIDFQEIDFSKPILFE
ncbi:MAG: hypothetical protein AB1540_00680 [Bdellovibrionota bacterium]